MTTDYDQFYSWIKTQPPEVLERIIADLQRDWNLPASGRCVLRLRPLPPRADRIMLIKDVHTLTGLGLAEAKRLVDTACSGAAAAVPVFGTHDDLRSRTAALLSAPHWEIVPDPHAS